MLCRTVRLARHLRPEIRLHRAMSNEAEKAATAKDTGEETIFDKIIRKEIPSDVVYEDDKCLAFRDISPQAPVHVLLIPKERDGLTRLFNANEKHQEILGHLMVVAAKIAKQENMEEGYRVVVNDGINGCQSVYHLHLHLLGGRKLGWPPG